MKLGGVTRKLNGSGGGGWLCEREREIRERSENICCIIFFFYIILMCSMLK